MIRPHRPCKRAVCPLPITLESPRAVLSDHHVFPVSSSPKSLYLPLRAGRLVQGGVGGEEAPNWGGAQGTGSDFQSKCASRDKTKTNKQNSLS